MDWMKNLKPGDKVLLSSAVMSNPSKLVAVERITPTGRVVIDGAQFTQDGWERVKSYSRKITEATPENIENMELRAAEIECERLYTLRYNAIADIFKYSASHHKATREQVEQIAKILEVERQ